MIRSTLEAKISLVFNDAEARARLEALLRRDAILVSDLFISGSVNLLQGNPFEVREIAWNSNKSIGAVAHKSKDHKCGRCWRHLPEVAEDGDLCGRCETVVGQMQEAGETGA